MGSQKEESARKCCVNTGSDPSNLLLPVGTGGCREAAGRRAGFFQGYGLCNKAEISLKLQEEVRAACPQDTLCTSFPL